MANNTWLQNLKAGDPVIVRPGIGRNNEYVATVTHSTPTQIHVGHAKFRRSNGDQIGVRVWDASDLLEPTPAAIETIHLRDEIIRRARQFGELNWRKLPIDALEQIERIIAANMEKDEGK